MLLYLFHLSAVQVEKAMLENKRARQKRRLESAERAERELRRTHDYMVCCR